MNRIFSLNEEEWTQLMEKHKRNTWLPKLRRLAQHVNSQHQAGAREQEDYYSLVKSYE